MIPRIRSVHPLPDRVLSVQFDDGQRVLYNTSADLAFTGYDVFSIAPGLFARAKLDKSRQYVEWTESVYVSAELIYENGQIVEE